jgi:hypothetical protein
MHVPVVPWHWFGQPGVPLLHTFSVPPVQLPSPLHLSFKVQPLLSLHTVPASSGG